MSAFGNILVITFEWLVRFAATRQAKCGFAFQPTPFQHQDLLRE